MSLQGTDLDVAVEHVDQRGQLSDHLVPLSHADLRHRHQHLQLHLLPPARLYRHNRRDKLRQARRRTRGGQTPASHLVGPPRWPWRSWSGPERRSLSAGTGRCPPPGWRGRGRPASPSRTARPATGRGQRLGSDSTPTLPHPHSTHACVHTDPSSWTLAVSGPQVADLALVSVSHRPPEDQGAVGEGEGVAAAGVSDRRKTSGCRRTGSPSSRSRRNKTASSEDTQQLRSPSRTQTVSEALSVAPSWSDTVSLKV